MKPVPVAMMLALLILVAPLSADRKKDKARSDQKLIVGKWKVAERHFNGEVRKEFDREIVVEFTTTEIVFKAGDREFKGKYKIDPEKSPGQMDQTFTRGDKSITRKAIYVLKGDTLKICTTRSGTERPKKLEAKAGDEQNITVFQRVKARDK